MLRIDGIELTSEIAEKQELKQPKRLLELWANRWLSIREQTALGNRHKDENDKLIGEHQPGSFQRRGLVDAYRFNPDPLAPVVKHF
jgi:hypothetical protein